MQGSIRDNSIQWKVKSARVDALETRINDQNLQLVRAENERDNARAKLAPFELMAARVYTNELPSEALGRLYKELQPDEFSVDLNGIPLTGETNQLQLIVITNGVFHLGVVNKGRFPLQHLSFYCSGRWMEETNVIAFDWQRTGSTVVHDELGADRIGMWRLLADSSVGRNLRFLTHPITIRTNVLQSLSAGYGLTTFIRVNTDKSEDKEFRIFLVITNK